MSRQGGSEPAGDPSASVLALWLHLLLVRCVLHAGRGVLDVVHVVLDVAEVLLDAFHIAADVLGELLRVAHAPDVLDLAELGTDLLERVPRSTCRPTDTWNMANRGARLRTPP